MPVQFLYRKSPGVGGLEAIIIDCIACRLSESRNMNLAIGTSNLRFVLLAWNKSDVEVILRCIHNYFISDCIFLIVAKKKRRLRAKRL